MQTKILIDLLTLAKPVQVVTDDAAVKEYLSAENLLNSVQLVEPHDHVSVRFVTETAYCCASLDVGHERPEDNGYTLLLVSRALVDEEQAARILQSFVDAGKRFGPNTPSVEFEETIPTVTVN